MSKIKVMCRFTDGLDETDYCMGMFQDIRFAQLAEVNLSARMDVYEIWIEEEPD